MTTQVDNSDLNDTLKLVGEVYKSILRPESFIEVLELWDRSLSYDHANAAQNLAILEEQLTNAIPLLEASLKSVVNQDELINRLAEFDRPSLLVSANGMVIGGNNSGQALFNLRAGDKTDLSLLTREDASEFRRMMSHAYSGRGEAFKVINFASPAADGSIRDHLVACRSIFISATKIGYIILSAMDLVLSDSGASAFKRAFSATDAEMRIVQELTAGRRQIEIAKQLNIREDTVKKHIKSLREKAGVPHTTALICLAASFAQISAEYGKLIEETSDAPHSITNASNQTYVVPVRHKIIEVNGLQVEYIDDGDPNGKPILILHSSMVGIILPPEFISEFVKAGYRLITPFRPGYGISSPLEEFSPENAASHLLDFASALDLETFTVIGGTTGFVHGAYIAALSPDRVKQLIGIAGYVPIGKKLLLKTMAPYQRAVLVTQEKSRKLAKFLVLSGYKLYLQLGAHNFMSQIMRHSKADLRVVNNSNSLGVISIGLRIGGAQGVDALLEDTALVLLDWIEVANRIKCPIHLFHGTDDSVYKLENIQGFCKEHPHFKLTAMQDRGQLMIYDTPKEMARTIIGKLLD